MTNIDYIKIYIGPYGLVKAKPMTCDAYLKLGGKFHKSDRETLEDHGKADGYIAITTVGTILWWRKETFEEIFREVNSCFI